MKTLLLVYFISAAAVSTLGLVPGALRPLAAACGIALLAAAVRGYAKLGQHVSRELGRGWLAVWLVALIFQLFWALFKAPLDIDGLFYHLAVILEALDKNRWGAWELKLWHILNAPHLGEIPNLCLVSLGGSWGWRLAQLGHFSTGILGALAIFEIARSSGARRPSLYALAFWSAPLAVKQMGSNYVDIASWSSWLASAAALMSVNARPAAARALLSGAGAFLHAGIKASGPLTALALLPLIFLEKKQSARARFYIAAAAALFVLAGMSVWMIPNFLRHGNPVYPLAADVTPAKMGIGTDFHPPAFLLSLPKPLSSVLQFVVPEPVAVYDQSGGALGFVGIWSLFMLVLFFSRKIRTRRSQAGARVFGRAIGFLTGAMLLYYFLMPAREIPRHGFAGHLVIMIAGLWVFERGMDTNPAAWRKARTALVIAFMLQFFYILPDRAVFRGAELSRPERVPGIIAENLSDIITHGEPQAPGRWLHYPFVPAMRRDEPRTAVIDSKAVPLLALYWGRKFSNRVLIDPSFSRWPY
ncbi:MAG: hypothetical protein A2583_15185 [Bdellovibrionales bacterium RIFOXYD1_FULL_53_11]|nr:MAG: hypothetical protein A2583_15185 [Bdellovibrionales bacterium RIFOXYD1_FULL_53_11]